MRKILITGVTAALAFGLTACGGNGDGKPAAAPPSSSPTQPAPAPSATATPSHASGGTSGDTSDGGGASTPADSGGSDASTDQQTPPVQQGKPVWGQLRYMAPGKFIVGDIAFFVSDDTAVYVAGGECPDGSTPPDDSKCSVTGLDDWAKAAPHNVTVRFSGQVATMIRETQ